MTPTLDQRALDRLARQCERDLKFLRHSPHEQQGVPFADEAERAEIIDAVIGGAVFFAFAGALIWLPELMALIERAGA
ncbi:hypothetical protein MXC99_01950 [Thauera aromatica]|uniref:hypothetical protein n=1 Tax=Thauera aromatica TaxID=59405 RepID=UPI001FFD1E59|nr:hypothetical protein [Thauera aromatica]MCK2086952.1 hypothetical protein [Thauera aromatica]